MLVVAVDAGSIRHHRVAWSAQAAGGPAVVVEGHDPDSLARHVTTFLKSGERVAFGFESPLVLPVPDASRELGAARVGESGRSWSASAGASVMATGLVQLAWTLRRLAPVAVTTTPQRWSDQVPLLLWEAFVSGPLKTDRPEATGHLADARAAVRGLLNRRDTLAELGDVHLGTHQPFNLAAAAAVQAELDISPDEIRQPLLVVAGATAALTDGTIP